MSWFIQADINDGYPAQDTWRQSWETGWTSGNGIRYPDNVWRIKVGVNDGYPWLYPWFKETQIDTGDMVIGGSQTNYPGGLTGYGHGGIEDYFDETPMISNGSWNLGGSQANTTLMAGLSGKAFAIGSAKLQEMLTSLNDTDIFDASARTIIMQMYGANVFDSIQSCKVFPFDLANLSYMVGATATSVISGETAKIKAFGKYELTNQCNLLSSTMGFYQFPDIHIPVQMAWEVENIDFSIYLPYSGVYPIDVREECDVSVMLYVDLINGTGEYYVHVGTQLSGIYRILLGVDVPINTNQGRMQANMLTNVVSTVSRGLGGLIGGALEGAKGGLINATGGIGGTLSSLMPRNVMTTPAVGGMTSAQCYPWVRVMAKIPKRFKDCYGYKQTIGLNRSTAYYRLAECSGYIRCRNYKTDIIVATDTEKLEIERLMNEGVFV